MIIDMATITRLNEDIKENIELATILHKERLYEEFAQNNLFLQKEILFNSIAYAKVKEDTNNLQEILHNYEKEPNRELYISEDVPDAIIHELLQHITTVLKKGREYFPIEASQNGRYDLLFKGVLHYIKLLNLNLQKHSIVVDSKVSDIIKPMNLQNVVDLYFDKMIDCAVIFCKCYEADSKNNKLCREVLGKNFKEYYRYQYKLDKKIKEKLKRDIHLIIDNINNLDKHTKDIDFEESKIHLSNTLSLTQKYIDDIICNNNKLKSDEFKILINTYKQLFTNSRNRFKTSQKTNNFLIELKKANMFHRMTYEGKVIYPFLFDLIVMNFIYSTSHIQYKDIYTDSNRLAETFNANKYEYLEKSSDENYYFNEFTRAAEEIPKEYKELNDPTILIIKHYSEFLNCEYGTVAAIFRQLRFEFTDANKSVYNLLLPQRNIDLNFDDDYFRKLSLYII
jgi:hypothetical protein